MIDRMIGSIEGNSIVFYFNPESQTWDAQVPSLPSGEYVIEVIAYDVAGNPAYAASMLFSIDLNCIEIRILEVNYAEAIVDLPFRWIVKPRIYQTHCFERFDACELPERYSARLLSEVM